MSLGRWRTGQLAKWSIPQFATSPIDHCPKDISHHPLHHLTTTFEGRCTPPWACKFVATSAKLHGLNMFGRDGAAEWLYLADQGGLSMGRKSTLADNKQVFYMDIGSKFLSPDGTMSAEVMADGLHPTANGYQIWADAIKDT